MLLAGLAGRCAAVQRNELPDFLLASWDGEDGLPVASIHEIVRTREGYLWIATSAGLARFDGARFVVFTTNNTPALGDNRATCLTVDAAGDLWVGTGAGTLARRRGEEFVPVELSPEIRGKPLNSMVADPTGAIWLATQGAGLVRLRGGVVELFGVSDGLPANTVSQVVVTDGGQIFALAGGRLASFDGGRWKTQVVPVAQNSTPRHKFNNPKSAPRNHPPGSPLPGGIIMSFADGHVEPVKLEKLWSFSWHLGYVAPPTRPN